MTMLVSLSDMKAYLDITDGSYDDFLTMQINIVSDAIEGYCGRKFTAADYTQTFYSRFFTKYKDPYNLFLYHFPINSITSVTEIETDSTGATNETIVTSDNYLLKSNSGEIKKQTVQGYPDYFFSEYGYPSKVQIVYNAGYTTIPYVIQDVVYNLVTERYNKKSSGVNVEMGTEVSKLNIPGVMGIEFDYSMKSENRKVAFGEILALYTNSLDHYRSERAVMGEIEEGSYVS